MIKQDWMVIVAGEALVDALTAETQTRCRGIGTHGVWTNSEDLCALQRDQAARGILGAEIVASHYGYSVRYDSGLQGFAILASSRNGTTGRTIEDAEQWARAWVAKDPERRYAWRRRTSFSYPYRRDPQTGLTSAVADRIDGYDRDDIGESPDF